MKTVGIVIDDWKLPIFERHLDKADLVYDERPFTNNTTLLKVACTFIHDAHKVVMAANTECEEIKGSNHEERS